MLQPIGKSIKLKYDQLKLPKYTMWNSQQKVRHQMSMKLNFKVVFKYNQPLAYISILPRKPCWIIIMESFHLSFTTFWQCVTRKSKNLSSGITLPNPRTTSWSHLIFVTIFNKLKSILQLEKTVSTLQGENLFLWRHSSQYSLLSLPSLQCPQQYLPTKKTVWKISDYLLDRWGEEPSMHVKG